jgi:acyl-CoA thioester hydrolase
MEVYSLPYEVRWTDIDINRHVRYSAYIDAAAELRYRFLNQHGFSPNAFERLGIGLIYTSLAINFYREVFLGETLQITFCLTGMSPQKIRWKVRHDFLKANGKKAATLILEGAFLDMATRQPIIPTPGMMDVFLQVPRTPDFEAMSESKWFKTRPLAVSN